MSWEKKPLEVVADFCLGKMLDQKKNKGELLPYLANVNVRWGSFDLDDLREMRFEHYELDRYGLKSGDIIMCEGGEPGRCALWKGQKPGMMIQKALHRIRPHNCLLSEFLFYYLLYIGRTGHLAPLFTGATIKHLPREKLAKVKVMVPPLGVQHRIASTLSAYDDLIENNRRRVRLLEQAARLLYKEWFVRLRFPGYEHVKVKDGVPEGWERKPLFEIAMPTYGFAFRSNLFNTQGEGLPVTRIRDILAGESRTYTTEEASEDKLLENGDFVVGMDGDFHMNFWAGGKAWINQRVVKISGLNDISTAFLRYALEKPIQDFNATIAGTTVAHLGAKHLKLIKILIPTKDILHKIQTFLRSTQKQIVILSNQSRHAQDARDLLLPHLMRGEVVV